MTMKASSSPGGFLAGEKLDPEAIGYCLSGGGYRAALFHLGGLIRLNELGLMRKLARVSSVSGGSITAGALGVAWSRLTFDHNDVATNLDAEVVTPVLRMTRTAIDVKAGALGLLMFVSSGTIVANAYDSVLFHGATLQDLPSTPVFVINATNLQTGGLMRFSRRYAADWRAFIVDRPTIRLADAVAASSAFPLILSPVRLALSGTVTVPQGAIFDDPHLRRRVVLVDGGVYDNLGLETTWKRCGVLLVNNGSRNTEAAPGNFSIHHLVRTVMTMLDHSINMRERVLIDLYTRILADGLPERAGAYWGMNTRIADYRVGNPLNVSQREFETARQIRTRLDRFSSDEQDLLIKVGYTLADAARRASRCRPHPFVRSGRQSPSSRPRPPSARRAGAVQDAARGTGGAGAQRPGRPRAQCQPRQRGTSSSIPSAGLPTRKTLAHWWGVPPASAAYIHIRFRASYHQRFTASQPKPRPERLSARA